MVPFGPGSGISNMKVPSPSMPAVFTCAPPPQTPAASQRASSLGSKGHGGGHVYLFRQRREAVCASDM
jgi:hypothetical protein